MACSAREKIVIFNKLKFQKICDKIQKANGRKISEYLKDLLTAGFITADFTWDFKTKKVTLTLLYVIKLKCKTDNLGQKAPGFPLFLIAFVVFMTMNSVLSLPVVVQETAGQVSQFALIISKAMPTLFFI